ncbi:MAG: phosphate ABC transporter permease subunit PstC [Oscillospiraceae bacterium]|jgi:phosphate transport system permease protein|nr:phosphate ABC transporter permease subunit PstC [Oscillospiraceae bacterium]
MKIKNIIEQVMKSFFFICGMMTIIAMLTIAIYLIINGVPAIREVGLFNFLFGQIWAPVHSTEPQFGILPFILTSIYGTFGAVLIGVPIGLMTAIFLSKLSNPKISVVVNTAVELLAGIPSVVYGFIGLSVLVPLVRETFGLLSGATLFSAIIVLSIMILPNIINVSRVALAAVPTKYEEASYALGATKMETIFKVSMPAARSGIAAGVVLGIGRAIGEAMAVMMVAGNVANMPELFRGVRFLTTAIASELSYAAAGIHRNALFSIALVLFVFIIIINIVLNLLLKRGVK